MRTKALSRLLCLLVLLMMLPCLAPIRAGSYAYTADEVQSLIDGILAYKLQTAQAGDIQTWLNGALTAGAGTTSEWYVMTLSQYGDFDTTSYRAALEAHVTNTQELSATTREKNALALSAAGSSLPYIQDCLNDSIGQQGIMSWIYGLHVLNNGYTCNISTDTAVDTLLSMQLPDGGWALWGEYGDIDVTAMTVQALAPQFPYRIDVQNAVNRAVDLLSARQETDGGYQSFGTANPESASQVLIALSALGIDAETDPRFNKDGNTLIDGIAKYRLPDGSFSHTEGDGYNETATMQALYAFVAYRRMANAQTPFYVFDHRQPVAVPTEAVQTDASAQTQSGISTTANANVETTAVSDAAGTTAITSETALTTFSETTTALTETAPITTQEPVFTTAAVTSNFIETSTISTEMHLAQETVVNSPAETAVPPGLRLKLILLLALGIVSLIVRAVLALTHKANWKNILLVVVLTAVGMCIILVTDIRTPDEYYGKTVKKDNAIGTVTLEIRCDTIVGKSDSPYSPEDGTILPVTRFEIAEGDTVFTVLTEAAQEYGIQVENTGSTGNAHGMVYIAGINYLYEQQFGDLSGWVYHVNGITPSRGCGEYVLRDGDVIEWHYTCELGHDLNEVYGE